MSTAGGSSAEGDTCLPTLTACGLSVRKIELCFSHPDGSGLCAERCVMALSVNDGIGKL